MERVIADAAQFPLAPTVDMSWLDRVRTMRAFNTAPQRFRDAGGPVVIIPFGPKFLVPTFAMVTSPQGARHVLAGSDETFDKWMVVHVEGRHWLGENVFSQTHTPWVPRRRALQPAFTKQNVRNYAGQMVASAQSAADDWAQRGTVDLNAEIRRLTLQVVGLSVFGTDLGSHDMELGRSLEQQVRFVTNRALRPIRAPYWLPTPYRRRFRRAQAVTMRIINQAVDDAIADPTRNAPLIREVLDAKDPETGRGLTRAEVAQELFAFAFAGHDTTATTLTYALWQVGRDVDLQNRIAAEVKALGDRPLTAADVADLPLTVAVIHEALRMFPPAPLIGRMAMRDAVVDGFRIPAGTNVMVGAIALHRDPALWSNPDAFEPDRFMPGNGADRDRWQFIPFGGGPRTCIGDHFAMLEAALALATVVRAAKFESVSTEITPALPFTMTVAGRVDAKVTRRT
ncbi:cytochrome P450 [Smaragdicoccus niigatensis]|uniref:cytochrome P450 n=1 Tax=Smaragdicoccus niigatensis TaxID=359359 RepID=UPI0003638445|nr:cytochrome P450 [Smaragdicoccus niigatensis]